jgi:hypothetical protein
MSGHLSTRHTSNGGVFAAGVCRVFGVGCAEGLAVLGRAGGRVVAGADVSGDGVAVTPTNDADPETFVAQPGRARASSAQPANINRRILVSRSIARRVRKSIYKGHCRIARQGSTTQRREFRDPWVLQSGEFLDV